MTRDQEVRHEVLLQLAGAGSLGITLERIEKVSKREGSRYSAHEIREALFFLKGQGFCTAETVSITGQRLHTITSAGILAYENSDN